MTSTPFLQSEEEGRVRALPRLGADVVVEREFGRQLEDRHDRRPLSRRHQFRRDALNAQIRRQSKANRLQGAFVRLFVPV